MGKVMKAAGSKAMTASAAYRTVSETTGVKARDVKGAMEAYVSLVAAQVKKNGAFKLGGALNLKLKKKPARPARKGEPFHEGAMYIQSEACVQGREGVCD